MINDACGGCSVPGTRRGLLRQQNMLRGCGCGIPMGGHHAVLALRRTATSSSGYDSFYSRRCYMLRSIRDVPQAAPVANPPSNVANDDREQPEYEKNNGLENSQPRQSTLCTTDEQRRWTWKRELERVSSMCKRVFLHTSVIAIYLYSWMLLGKYELRYDKDHIFTMLIRYTLRQVHPAERLWACDVVVS